MFAANTLIFLDIYVPLLPDMEKPIQFDALVSHLPGMVYRCCYDPGLTLIFASEQSANLTGHTTSSLLSKPHAGLTDLAYYPDRDRIISDLRTQLQKCETFSLEYRLYTADKQLKWVCNRGCLIVDENEHQQYLEGFIFDMTPMREEQELMRANEAHFRRTVHDFNQPVDIINTLANLCLLSLAEGSRHFAFLEEKLNKIIDQSERMTEMTNQAMTNQMRFFTPSEDKHTPVSVPTAEEHTTANLAPSDEIPLVCDQSANCSGFKS